MARFQLWGRRAGKDVDDGSKDKLADRATLDTIFDRAVLDAFKGAFCDLVAVDTTATTPAARYFVFMSGRTIRDGE